MATMLRPTEKKVLDLKLQGSTLDLKVQGSNEQPETLEPGTFRSRVHFISAQMLHAEPMCIGIRIVSPNSTRAERDVIS